MITGLLNQSARRWLAISSALLALAIGSLLFSGTAAAITMNGYGHYCSMTWPTGGWALQWEPSGGDPCGAIKAKADPGGTVQRAGLYDSSGVNNVVVRCSDNTLWMYSGRSDGSMGAAFKSASGHPGCIFTVAPQNLPIFSSPFKDVTVSPGTGFDFARPEYGMLDVAEFGQAASVMPSGVVNFRGVAQTSNFIDNHDGYDWNVPEGTSVYAVADGIIEANRTLDTGSACSTAITGSNSQIQGEMYLRVTAGGTDATYNETFIAGYFHMTARENLPAGSIVKAGQLLGTVGWVGCSSGSHLHFGVTRISNVANYYRAPFAVPNDTVTANNSGPWLIDPQGFRPPKGFDPWAWKAFPSGALSINLWRTGQAPPLGNWAN